MTSTLPAPFRADDSTIRVLHVADIHLNQAAWEIIRSLIEQYDITMVIDAGDLTDHGTAAENAFVDPISTLGVPYVFVRGNHDSGSTQVAVAAEPNAIVLDDGSVQQVAGLRIVGMGDPRFTPDLTSEIDNQSVVRMGERLAREISTRAQTPDIAVVHDASAAPPLDGQVPLVLAGHAHRRSTEVLEGGTRVYIQGSTGGAGLRALETDEPTPIMCSVLYFDGETHRLQAWDNLTLGGLGEQTATITRHLAEPAEAGA